MGLFHRVSRTPSRQASLYRLEPLEPRLLFSAGAPAHDLAQPVHSPAPVPPSAHVRSVTEVMAGAQPVVVATPAAAALAELRDSSGNPVPVGSKAPTISPAELTSLKAAIAAVQIRPTPHPPAEPPKPIAAPAPVIAWRQDDEPFDPGASFETALRYQRPPAWQKTFLIGPQPDDPMGLFAQHQRFRISLLAA